MVISNTGTVLPHDLLWGMSLSALPDDAPKWAVEAVLAGQPVVVRRQAMPAGQVAVGLRGRGREQRYASSMPLADVCRRVMPEQLIEAPTESLQQWPALQALRQIRPVMEALELDWGVGGSAGFELASGIAALHQDSDLDLILRTPGRLSRRCAAELVEALETSVCRVDVQLQLEQGAVALREWARPTGRVLLKTASGARLVADPWHLGQVCA
ncbi:malonate decarboxylase holo-ACP synthase [Pseudomonas syringae]|uniref:Phosphoribosyl-dephospho-CoA transferase n=1 Tax=Pseudomonas syringae pv. papulans TaxID=83963 RepID=A0A0P9X3S0_PSESX|nr:malonate decarboxylase holo-ACP synthase [Pseudomonas syringae]KPY28138.1 Phosphoribosyl-dephospho-CoA transferase [Pseudomonas syringae pv. papulans]KWS41374.1 phosphoribosyl-dephospho-CoA transferase [Pseudomonas syringae pv. papulans]MDH4602232.1 malonate decarboxylase holo-ACP synthase [Pseudomonas syringae pv. papulans]MDH4620688.1 malonate decarboxylase holo-ACP synthase [Pseudomonas syringae pv. papulans]RMN41642.1 Phosphoribosyl-dephospho-CoA transferase [Pseudomonas syringae pv. pa